MNLPGMKIRVKFTEPFKDGQIFGPKIFKLNEEAEITSDEFDKARRSGAKMEVLGQVLPPPDWGENPPPAPEQVIDLESLPLVLGWREPKPAPEPLPAKPTRKNPKKAAKDGKA